MIKLVAISCVILFLQNCTSNKTIKQSEIIPELPYRLLEKGLDTTFDYQISKAVIHATLPDSIFGSKVKGGVEFYSMINAGKQVVGIKLLECRFYDKKNNLVYEYDKNISKEPDNKIRNYLLAFMQNIPFKQNKTATLQEHPTYCYVGFYK